MRTASRSSWSAGSSTRDTASRACTRYPSEPAPRWFTALVQACEQGGATIVTSAGVDTLIARADGRIVGVRYERPDRTTESVGCDALVLACSGFGGNADLVREHIPEVAQAPYFGHAGNRGDALRWGRSSVLRCATSAPTRATARSRRRTACSSPGR